MVVIGGDFGWTCIVTQDREDDHAFTESELLEFEKEWETVRQTEKEITEVKLSRNKKSNLDSRQHQ